MAQGATLQTLSIDDDDLALKRRVITNVNELIQKELFTLMEQT